MAKKGFGSARLNNISEAGAATQNLLRDAFAESGYTYGNISLKLIDINPENDYAADDNAQEIRNLAEDIRRQGLLHNIVLSRKPDGRYLILSGERRYRAYCLLFEEEQDLKWSKIYSKIIDGLDAVQEMLVLDAANLQVRGGLGNERRYREATARFVRNLQKSGAIDREQALKMAADFVQVEQETLRRNVNIEEDLAPALRELLNAGQIPKASAALYAQLDAEMQESIAQTLKNAFETRPNELHAENERLTNTVKEQKRLIEELENKQRELTRVESENSALDREISELNEIIEDGGDPEELRAQLAACEEKRRLLSAMRNTYTAAIQNARLLLETEKEKVRPAPPIRETPMSAPILRNLEKLDRAVSAMSGRNGLAKARKLSPEERKLLLNKLDESAAHLQQFRDMLEQISIAEQTITLRLS